MYAYARAIDQLQYVNTKYVLIVLEDTDYLLVDSNLELDSKESPDIVIKYFEDEYINRLNCYGDFSIEQIKENTGEEILFH